MKQSMIRKQNGLHSESGVTIVVITFFVVALFAFAALSLDVGNVLREQRKAQIGTDAAALAAVMRLTNTVQDVTAVTATATEIAGVNGVTATEIAASPVAAVQVGIWTNAQFYANQTIGSRYNAVRVPARRTVPLNFGRVVGLSAMQPVVGSVASLEYLRALAGLRPFAIATNAISGTLPGDYFDVDVKQNNSGQWGKVHFNPDTESWSTDDWRGYMANGYKGLVDFYNARAVIQQSGTDSKSLEDLADRGEEIFIPVVQRIEGPNTFCTVIGFIGVRVTIAPKPGNKQVIRFTMTEALATGTPGGIPGPYSVQGRFLVK